MLNKNQSNKRNSWKYAVVLPLLGAFLFLFQVKVVAQERESEQTEIKLPKTDIVITKNTTDEEIKQFCEQLKKMYKIDLTFFNIKRNSNGEIISIESKDKDMHGSGSYAQSGNTPIKPFKFFYDDSKKEMGYFNMDLSTLSKGKEIYINGEKSSQEELDKLNPKEIERIDVAKVNNKESILITPKRLIKPIKITDKDIYINGVKSTNDEFSKLDEKTIDKMDVDTFENTVRITTKSGKPIVIVDGIQKESSFKVEDLPTDQIKEVNVLKGKLAEDKYGEKGKNGVIEIFTKNPTFSLSKTENITDKLMIIINGEKTKATLEDLKKLDPNLIQSMNVFKGKSAIEKYGKDGENGAIEIITKENADILKSSPTKRKKESELDKSEIKNTENEIVSSKGQWLETYKEMIKARFSLEKMKAQKEQAKVDLEKSRKALKSKLFS